MIHFTFKPSFEKSLKSLPKKDKETAKSLCIHLINILTEKERLNLRKGIGLKRLKNDWWEIRKGIKQRILFKWKNNEIEFILVGNHDQIKRSLK